MEQSSCSASCGGGTATQTSICVARATKLPLPMAFCVGTLSDNASFPLVSTVQCGSDPCSSLYRWIIESPWSPCSKFCDGGVSYRNVTCRRVADGLLSDNAASDCSLMDMPANSRTCNARPCIWLQFAASSWQSCSQPCGGVRHREIACIRASIDGSFIPVSNQECMDEGIAVPRSTEACSGCSVCTEMTCSGHGVCDPDNGTCECHSGYYCQHCQVGTFPQHSCVVVVL